MTRRKASSASAATPAQSQGVPLPLLVLPPRLAHAACHGWPRWPKFAYRQTEIGGRPRPDAAARPCHQVGIQRTQVRKYGGSGWYTWGGGVC